MSQMNPRASLKNGGDAFPTRPRDRKENEEPSCGRFIRNSITWNFRKKVPALILFRQVLGPKRLGFFIYTMGNFLIGLLMIVSCEQKHNSHESSSRKPDVRGHEVDSRDHDSDAGFGGKPKASEIEDFEKLELQIRTASLKEAEQLIGNLEKLTNNHPSRGLQFADALTPGVKRDLALRTVFSSYPSDRYEELFRWADSSDYKEDRELVKLLLNPGGPGITIQKAIELRRSLESPEIKSDLLDFVGISVGSAQESTFDDIHELSLSFPAEDRARLIDQFGYGVLQLDPGKAMELIYRHPDSFGRGFITTASRDAGLNAPNKHLDKIVSCANRPGGDLVLRSFIQGWLSNNSMEATQWVGSSLDGRLSDIGKIEIARFLILKGDRNTAKTYIDAVSDKSLSKEFDDL